MVSKDYFEIIYWFISLLILCVTIYYIYYAPIKAVKIGRQLNDEQNKDKAKRELFLTLFAYRGSPVNYHFVTALNTIDIVFQDELDVLSAWHEYYTALQQKDTVNQHNHWTYLRVQMLSQMGISLGYKELQQVNIMKHYYPEAHDNQLRADLEFRQELLTYLRQGNELYKILISNANTSQQVNTQE